MSLNISLIKEMPTEVFEQGITHNLNKMAKAAGLYECLWQPGTLGLDTAFELIQPLLIGIAKLEASPSEFIKLNPPNGWGSYETLLSFARDYLAACQENPDAKIRVSR